MLSFDDFLKIVGREKGFEAKGTVADLCQGFQVFDREGNGTITAGELRYGRQPLLYCSFLICFI